jgi:hypothetical protein
MTLLNQLPPARSMSTTRQNAASRQLAVMVAHTTHGWWRLSRSTTIALAVGLMLTGSAAAGVLIPTNEVPNPVVASTALTLGSSLAKQYPTEFAGITLSNDNATINVYVTGTSSGLRSAVLDQVPTTATVNFITVANTWASLLAIQDELESQLSALKAHGIDIVDFSTDPGTNREVIEVVNLSPSQTATLDQQFGAQKISVQAISGSQAPTPLASNW